MITLAGLAALAQEHRDAVHLPTAPVLLGDRAIDTDATPVVMGCLNLSRDSTYRDSVATSTSSALRRGRILAAQGADLVDVGAESTNRGAARVDSARQAGLLVPVVAGLSSAGVVVSVETYDPDVARACLDAGAQVLNLTGTAHQERIFDLAAEYDATVVLCAVVGADVREVADAEHDTDPVPGLLAHFRDRVALARSRGVDRLVLDPGLGFFYRNLTDPAVRIDYQTRVLLRTFRLRELGLPVCQALPHAFDLFQEQFRIAEPMFAVLARLGGTGVFRTHEVAEVRAVLNALQQLDPGA